MPTCARPELLQRLRAISSRQFSGCQFMAFQDRVKCFVSCLRRTVFRPHNCELCSRPVQPRLFDAGDTLQLPENRLGSTAAANLRCRRSPERHSVEGNEFGRWLGGGGSSTISLTVLVNTRREEETHGKHERAGSEQAPRARIGLFEAGVSDTDLRLHNLSSSLVDTLRRPHRLLNQGARILHSSNLALKFTSNL